MSATYLVPTKYTCDTYGCSGEAMGHTPFRLTEKNKLELDTFVDTALPEGWSRPSYVGYQCASCTAEEAERQRRDLIEKKEAMERAISTQAVADARLREAEAARKMREAADAAMSQTRQLVPGRQVAKMTTRFPVPAMGLPREEPACASVEGCPVSECTTKGACRFTR